MQDAELFFQAADHRHLLLYLDGLAEAEARRQTDVGEYARKRLDDYEALQNRIALLEQELQQEREANALLRAQASRESRNTAEAGGPLTRAIDAILKITPTRNATDNELAEFIYATRAGRVARNDPRRRKSNPARGSRKKR